MSARISTGGGRPDQSPAQLILGGVVGPAGFAIFAGRLWARLLAVLIAMLASLNLVSCLRIRSGQSS
jgi:hypothetical protein